MLTVRQGTVVLQAADASFTHPPDLRQPTAQFYVLHDNVALLGNDITNPQQSTDQAGQPDVSFSFTGPGQNEFQNVTARSPTAAIWSAASVRGSTSTSRSRWTTS